MRGRRAVAALLAALALAGCGTSSHALSPLFPAGPSGTRAPASAVTVHLGDDPRLAPVERLLSAASGKFDAKLFLSAFDPKAQACNIARIAQRVNGRPAQPPVRIATARAEAFASRGALGTVEVSGVTPLFLRLRRIGNNWIIDENACLWISEIADVDLPGTATSGLAQLAAGDPRRAPASALLAAMLHKFDASSFLSAFDLTNQPCDVPGLARSVANQTVADLPSDTPSINYFVRPIGRDQAGVLATAGDGTIPMRVHNVKGHWLLDENACSWLTLLVGAHLRGEDRGVQADLRNALTAEKTAYTDSQTYSASAAEMRAIEPALDWGHRLWLTVADVETVGDKNAVCLSEVSPSGTTWAIADIAVGPKAGTYYSAKRCPAPLTADAIAQMGRSFDAPR